MVSNVCTKLLKKVWRPYEVKEIPHVEGIYVIGIKRLYHDPEVIYVGRSNDVHRRMVEHKRQDLDIDEFIQEQFHENDGENLLLKWIKETNHQTKEMAYIYCIADKVGYWPNYNIRR